MKNYYFFFLIAILSACSEDTVLVPDPEIDKDVPIIEAIDQESCQINAEPLSIPDTQLEIFNTLNNARIVGLGEATHGTREFFQMKHRIFQYLVEQLGYDAFIFEMDLAEARYFNDWVQWRRNDNLQQLMIDKMIFWTWRTEEVKDLLEWIRSYNEDKIEDDMIGFYGVDVQFPLYDVDQLAEIIRTIDISKADSILVLNKKYKEINRLYSENLTDELVNEIRQGIDYAKNLVEENADAIMMSAGEEELTWARQLVRHMEQVHLYTYDKNFNNRYYQRDQYMAENTLWYFDLLGEDAQLALWAHNGHIANDAVYFGGGFGGSQGNHLKNQLREDYQVIGFSFAKGQFTAFREGQGLGTQTITADPKQGSTNSLLYRANKNQFILPTKTDDPTLNAWLAEQRDLLSIGAVFNGDPVVYYRNIRCALFFDYIIHFDETNYAVQL